MVLDPITKRTVDTLTRVITKKPPVGLHEPIFSKDEFTFVNECLHSGFVSSIGEFVTQFESALAEFTGMDHAVAVVNGTAALELALKACGVGLNDEVLMPALTFVATANAVSHIGAVPHFVDSCEETLGVHPGKLDQHLSRISRMTDSETLLNRETGRRIAALLPVNIFGHPNDMAIIRNIAERHQLPIIEDAAESLGSLYHGKFTGNWCRASAISFNGNKIITTGGGGAVVTNDASLALLIKHMSTTAKVPHQWEYHHDMVGYNYRMPNINASLGCAQIKQLTGFIRAKRELADRYHEAFDQIDGVTVFKEPQGSQSNYWLNTLVLDESNAHQRDDIIAASHSAGYYVRPLWKLLHTLPMYRKCPSADLSISESLERRIINLPSSADL